MTTLPGSRVLSFHAGFVALFALVPGLALAGPNAGGVLVVHDVGLATSDCPEIVPVPPSCADVDSRIDALQTPVCWRVYAVFPQGSSPRLKALCWGTVFDPQIQVTWGSLPDPTLDFEVPQGGWPGTSGCSIGESFGHTQTDLISCCYWFSGYAESAGEWRLAPHMAQNPIFVDDAEPPQVDMIADYGHLGFGVDGYVPCLTVSPVACCFASGDCQLLLPSACEAEGGQSYGAIPCVPGLCQVAGACCYPSGTCALQWEAVCASNGGEWYGAGSVCDPAICPEAFGACCHANGSCTVTQSYVCQIAGDVWQEAGSDCEPNPCPPPVAACCIPVTGECILETEAECAQSGGTWLFFRTCSSDPCYGACCNADGSCHWESIAACTAAGGQFQGVGAGCQPNPCPQYYGACCYPDGACLRELEPDCAAHDGQFRGLGTWCDPNPCPQVYGACCFPDGGCGIYSALECPAMGGTWQGDGTDCEPNPCVQPGGPNGGGVLVVHDCGIAYTSEQGEYPSDPPATCNDVDGSAAADSLLVWKVYAAFPLASNPRLKAASFGETFDALLVTVLDEGLPGGGDTQIGQDGWPDTPGGGVHITFGDTQTSRMVEICWFGGYGDAGGLWSTAAHPTSSTVFVDDAEPAQEDPILDLGSIGFDVAGDTPCSTAPLPGACCWQSNCYMVTAETCALNEGVYMGGSCTPNPCPQPGACCLPDYSCEVMLPAECAAQLGTFMGSGMPCDWPTCTGSPPPPVTGACGVDVNCFTLTASQGQEAHGMYLGDGSPCTPDVCNGPAPVERVSWGRLKDIFR